MKPETEKIIYKIKIYTGILLLPVFLVFFFSGFGMVNTPKVYSLSGGIIDRALAYDIHTLLAWPGLIIIAVHASLSTRSFLKRIYPKKNIDLPLAVIFSALFIFLAYLGFIN